MITGAGAATTLGAVDTFGLEPRWLDVSQHDVAVDRLPRILDGFRIAQVTDAHLESIGPVEEAITREVRRLNVNLVVLTGDIVDSETRFPVLKEFCGAVAGADRKVFATLGNWEHWGRVPLNALRLAYSTLHVELLVNEARAVDSAVCLIATDDSTGGNARIESAMSQRSTAHANLFLTHSPELLDRVPASTGRFDLALAGHTHGGQVRIGTLVPFRPRGSGRFLSGWYDVPTGRAYVSRGTGMSIMPARLFCRPELPVFTLRQG